MINEFDKLIDNYNCRTCTFSDSRNATASNFKIEIMEENLRNLKKKPCLVTVYALYLNICNDRCVHQFVHSILCS